MELSFIIRVRLRMKGFLLSRKCYLSLTGKMYIIDGNIAEILLNVMGGKQ